VRGLSTVRRLILMAAVLRAPLVSTRTSTFATRLMFTARVFTARSLLTPLAARFGRFACGGARRLRTLALTRWSRSSVVATRPFGARAFRAWSTIAPTWWTTIAVSTSATFGTRATATAARTTAPAFGPPSRAFRPAVRTIRIDERFEVFDQVFVF
jgi:hypothetical protein